jgi:hypothetical protein
VAESPPISITVSTIQGWPGIRRTIASVEAAAAAADGEVVVTDGSGRTPPLPTQLATTTTWRQVPGASIFQLRVLAYEIARGAIVAITEDHCRVPVDWGVRMIAAQRAHPEAAAIGGSVENGATGNGLDWASFLAVNVRFAPPIASGPAAKLAGAVNVSYKQEALSSINDFDGLGSVDIFHQQVLRQAGGLLLADDSIRVVHDQSLGLRGTVAIHYHSGRTFAGFLRRRMDAFAWTRLLGMPVIPYVRLGRTTVAGWRKGYGPQIARVWPTILLLYLIQAVGQAVGFVAGPGDSPTRVQ